MVILLYSDQKLSPESKRLHFLRETSNDLSCHDQAVTDNKGTREDDTVQQQKRVTFREPDGSCRDNVVGQYLCTMFDQNKQQLSPKGTIFESVIYF